jgi:hypothetical protein
MTRPLPPQTGKKQSGTQLNQSQAIQQLAKVLVSKRAKMKVTKMPKATKLRKKKTLY